MSAKKICCCIMLWCLMLNFIPGTAQAAPVEKEWGTSVSVVKLDGSMIDLNAAGFNGVVTDFAYMQITFSDTGANLAAALNPGHSLDEITVTGDAVYATTNFAPQLDNGTLKLQLNSSLNEGTLYTINIPAGIFIDGGTSINQALAISFVTTAAVSIVAVEPVALSAVDIAAGQSFCQIRGVNLADIQKVVLTPIAGRCLDLQPFIIAREDLDLIDAGTLKVMLKGNNAMGLGKEEASGTYRVDVFYGDASNPQQAAAAVEITLQVLSRGVPVPISFYPGTGSQYDEKGLLPQSINGTTRYFLSVRWQDPDGTLEFNQAESALNRLRTSSVYAEGGSQASMIDTDFLDWIENISDSTERNRCIDTYLYNRTTDTLYIPVRLLRPQTTYIVSLNEYIVKFTGGQGNALTTWSFTTMPVPAVLTVSPGSVVEDYPGGTYILIEGSFFSNSGVTVKFNDRWADSVSSITSNGKTSLKAVLPRSSRLKPGVYNVTVINDSNHQQTLYNALSVVARSDNDPPTEGQRTKSEGRIGDVVERVNSSEAILELDSDYRDRNYLALDLDKLMGEKVLTRTITFEGRRGDRIGELAAWSRWADITLYGLTLASDKNRDNVSLRLGRVDASRSAQLGSKLRGRVPLSDYIEVGGDNFRVDRVKIELPYSLSDGDNLKVLRYDDSLRNWLEAPCTVNRLERTVLVNNTRPGIFVIVE
ncbi:MAG TPA: hypothetical protein DER33_03785 [Syntrophomonas sp.]|nr:hypothetical protein [Syntrophomonas sp.]